MYYRLEIPSLSPSFLILNTIDDCSILFWRDPIDAVRDVFDERVVRLSSVIGIDS